MLSLGQNLYVSKQSKSEYISGTQKILVQMICNPKSRQLPNTFRTHFQGGDSAAGMQALPLGKIIDDKVCRKDN